MSKDGIILAALGWCISTLGAVSIALQVTGYYPEETSSYSWVAWVANVFVLLFGIWVIWIELSIAKRHTQRVADRYMKLLKENREYRRQVASTHSFSKSKEQRRAEFDAYLAEADEDEPVVLVSARSEGQGHE